MGQHAKTLGPRKDWAMISLNLHDENSLTNRVIPRRTDPGWAKMNASVQYREYCLARRTIQSNSFLREKTGVDPLAARERDGTL